MSSSSDVSEMIKRLDQPASVRPFAIIRAAQVAGGKEKELDVVKIFKDAGNKALGGGLAGAAAMAVQVTTLMWMRTTMNYQYRYGTSTVTAMKTLYKEGGGGLKGVLRFYKGYLPALAQGPLSRFGDTAANTGMLALMESTETTRNLPVALKTGAASVSAGLFRIVLMPIDCVKTSLQVDGSNGIPQLMGKIKSSGIKVLWNGSLASAAATVVGHFPWFYTYNTLDAYLPKGNDFMPSIDNPLAQKLLRSAIMGFTSSVVSDTTSNSIRVIKTTKQTHKDNITYPQAVREVLAKDGVVGLFGRGLGTRLITNGIQGLMFSVMWKLIQDQMAHNAKKAET